MRIASPDPDRARTIDRLGVVDAIIADYKAHLAPYEAERDRLEETLAQQYQASQPHELFVEDGVVYLLKVSACAEEQQLDIPAREKVFRLIKKDTYIALAKPTFEALKAALPPQKYRELIKKLRSGKRTYKTILKAAPVQVKAAA